MQKCFCFENKICFIVSIYNGLQKNDTNCAKTYLIYRNNCASSDLKAYSFYHYARQFLTKLGQTFLKLNLKNCVHGDPDEKTIPNFTLWIEAKEERTRIDQRSLENEKVDGRTDPRLFKA